MAWFAIRTVYAFGVTLEGANVFEERIVCIEAADVSSAYLKAARESEMYAEDHEVTAHPDRAGFRLEGDALADGWVLWSEFFESELDLDGFYADRYTRLAFRQT